MASVGNIVRRAPRWAWWTVGGIGIGAAAIYTIKNRAAPVDATSDASTDVVDSGTTGNEPYQMWDSSPVPGIVVPPIVTPAQGDQGVPNQLIQTYIDATAGTMNLLGGAFGQLLDVNVGLTHSILDENKDLHNTILQIPLAAAPAPAAPAPVGAIAVPTGPVVAAPAAPRCGGAYPYGPGPEHGCYAIVQQVFCGGQGRNIGDPSRQYRRCEMHFADGHIRSCTSGNDTADIGRCPTYRAPKGSGLEAYHNAQIALARR